MAGIDDAVLRRRQRDLDKRTADLQAYFERLARTKLAGMATEWQIIDNRIKRQIMQLYQDLGAIQDPAKLKAIKGKIERLEAYASQIEADLARNLPNQQAYATGILKHHFEKSYYMNAWAIEQAAKVTATVPVLTPAQVLGVLANPWLPDGATYSDRIRANTRLLAREMRTIIHQAVEDGTGWNEVARKISEKTGEGYFRAVRLARTEMNRAQALGQSYCYMQNQDILDGKRWNATLDSKTAPKDAANDGKIYELDYDTPENPGVPGQRIPNHPNCRCVWSPALSALGVSDKERIARDENGNRIYTQARTYREYAKERGLPDLDDRLANDNLKKYLRPGETVADLNKTVKRWEYHGKTIQVPTPDWVKPPKDIPPIAPTPEPKPDTTPTATEPDALAAVPENLRKFYGPDGNVDPGKVDAWRQSVTDDAQLYQEIMDLSDFEIKRQLGPEVNIDVDIAPNLKIKYNEYTNERYYGKGVPYVDKFNAAQTIAEKEAVIEELKKAATTADLSEVRDLFRTRREMEAIIRRGKREAAEASFKGFKLPEHGAALTDAERKALTIELPSGMKSPEIRDATAKANEWLTKYVHGRNAPATGIKLNRIRVGARAYARSTQGSIFIASDSGVVTVVHEAAHCIHAQNKATLRLVNQFFKDRTKGEKLTRIYAGLSEMGYKDHFRSHYIGKVYGFDKPGEYGTEVVSMGMQYMFAEPAVFFAEDPGHFKLIYAILQGWQGQ